MMTLAASGILVAVFLVVMSYLVVRRRSPLAGSLKDADVDLGNIWRWDGVIDRGPYAIIGVVLFAVKHNLDRIVASLAFHKPWSLFNYLVPSKGVQLSQLQRHDYVFYAT